MGSSVRWHEQIVDFNRLVDQAQVLLILHQRLQSPPVRLDAIGPGSPLKTSQMSSISRIKNGVM